MDVFPFAECDSVDAETRIMSGAFGDVFRTRNKPIPPTLPADTTHPMHITIYHRLRHRFQYLRDAQLFSECDKKADLVCVFVLLEMFKDLKPIWSTRLPNDAHDAEWCKLYHVARDRLSHFAANAYKIRTKRCFCSRYANDDEFDFDEFTCADFVYPEYEALLKAVELESKKPFMSQMEVFMHLRRIVGNDMALEIIDFV